MSRTEMPLVGDDGQFMTGELSTEIYEGDGVKTLHKLLGGDEASSGGEGFYVIEAFGTQTFFPKGMEAGDLYPALGTEVLKTGDKVRKLTLVHVADCTGWNIQITQGEIDVTRLKDKFKKYRLGKKDASGTVNSIMTLGVSDEPNGIVGKTMKLFRRSIQSNGDVDVVVVNNENLPIYFLGYLRKTDTPGETEAFVFGQCYLYNITLGGQTGSAQSYDSSLRLTGKDPVFFSLDIPGLTA